MKCLTAVSMVHRFGFTDLCELHNQLHSQPHYQPISAKEFNRRIGLDMDMAFNDGFALFFDFSYLIDMAFHDGFALFFDFSYLIDGSN
jgi:hypothetical protein